MQTSFEYISEFFILSGFLVALIIRLDIANGRPQKMRIMNAVWLLTGIWASWIGLYTYFKIGRTPQTRKIEDEETENKPEMKMNTGMKMDMDMDMDMGMKKPPTPLSEKVLLSTLHCGAGCTLADILGEGFTYYIPLSVGGSALAAQWILDYILALMIGIGFQYAAIRPMEDPNIAPGKTIRKAFKIDFFSLTAWQIGMYGYSAIVFFGFSDLIAKNTWSFWLMMQIAMFCGCLTSYPVNWLLVKYGVKKAM